MYIVHNIQSLGQLGWCIFAVAVLVFTVFYIYLTGAATERTVVKQTHQAILVHKILGDVLGLILWFCTVRGEAQNIMSARTVCSCFIIFCNFTGSHTVSE